MEKEKKKSGKFILGIILGLLVGVCCSFGYFKFINPQVIETTKIGTDKEKKNDNATKECPKVYSAYDDIVITNVEKFMHADEYYCGTQDFYFKNEKVTPNDISNELAYLTATHAQFNNKETLSKEKVESEIAALFGKDYKFTPTDELSAGKKCSPHYYDANTNSYPYQELACGGTCGPTHTEYYPAGATLENGILTIDIKVLFRTEDEYAYFSDVNKTQKINAYDKLEIIKQGKSYKFTLKEENGNYVLVSSEPSN